LRKDFNAIGIGNVLVGLAHGDVDGKGISGAEG
jgi:hypothetical protein